MRKIRLFYMILIICLLSVGGWYLWGGLQKEEVQKSDKTSIEAINEAMHLIEGESVYSTGKEKLIEGAIRGMADAIEDPYSTYYTKEEAAQHRQSLAEERVGVGLEITESGGKFIVVSPVKSSPADRAGIRPLDEIVQVNEERLGGKSMSELMRLIQGEKGTALTIVVFRPSADKHIKVTMEREAISNTTVTSKVVTVDDTSIGYVSISIFGEKTAEEWVAETTKLLRKDVEGIVIDVRDNPGGYLHSVRALISSLLDNQKVFTYMQNGEGAMEPINTDDEGFDKNYVQSMRKMPLVLLQNGGSASASEVLSGALGSLDRASIIGTTSFGKGTVQESWDLTNGGELKLSTNKWLTPKQEWIHGKGIEAELLVEQNELFALE
ncbi:MAG: S41 family peptidase, partial [Lysinibacillus sp.]